MKVDTSLSDVQNLPPLASPPVTPLANTTAPQVPQHSNAEEIGMLFSQQVELSSKALDQRQLSVSSAGSQVERIEQLAQLYDQLGHPAQASLAHMARQVRIRLLQRASVEDVLKLTGDDPVRTHVVLQHAGLLAQVEGRSHEAQQADEMLAQVHAQYAPQIQAGLNTAHSLLKGCQDPDLRQAVRQLYYASVVVRQSLALVMQSLLGLFGSEGFNNGLQLMRRALADDVAARSPSSPTVQLRTLLLGLQACGQLNGVLCGCRELMLRLPPEWPRTEAEAVALLQRLLGYASTGIAPSEVERLGRELGGEGLSGQLVMLNALYPLLQSLPLALWCDSRGRQDALHNFLTLMGERTTAEGRLALSLAPSLS